ncbi:MAG: glycosyltransferase domain-containing protein [Paracoccaceae bacterium]
MSIVIYSALYGDSEPLNLDVFGGFTSVRRVFFTDRADLRLPGAEVIIDTEGGLDTTRASRRAKLRPHRYFPDEEWSIWIDNKSSLLRDPLAIVEDLRPRTDVSFFAYPHFIRDCVYQEARAVLENGLEDHRIVADRLRQYRAEGMPEHAGLIEGHFIVRRHHDPAVSQFGDLWFEELCRHSRRDQLSFPYLVWKTALPFAYLDPSSWAETVRFDALGRASRSAPFPRRDRLRQLVRGYWHRLKPTR